MSGSAALQRLNEALVGGLRLDAVSHQYQCSGELPSGHGVHRIAEHDAHDGRESSGIRPPLPGLFSSVAGTMLGTLSSIRGRLESKLRNSPMDRKRGSGEANQAHDL